MSTSRNEKTNIDSVYYRDGAASSHAMSVLIKARKAMFDLFMSELTPGPQTKIVDIGVSDEENEGANFLQKLYPYRNNITCAGIGDGHAVQAAYPETTFKKITPGERLPFRDNEFDIACSNAVLEHVGGATERLAFINEHLRVARAAFITVPNRWFPVEHHTKIPLVHYSPRLFRRVLRGGKLEYWADRRNLEFLDRKTIRREWRSHIEPKIRYTGIALGPLSSNLAIIVNR